MHPKFGKKTVHVILHRGQLDAEVARDHLVRKALLQQPQDLRLARRETDHRVGATARVRDRRDVTEQKARDPR